MKHYIGIDPGKSGGMAMVDETGYLVFAVKTTTPSDIADILWPYGSAHTREAFALIEKVHAMPGQGVTSMFTFGWWTGMVYGVLAALGIPTKEITPQRWQAMFAIPKTQSRADHKRALKMVAQRLFPSAKVTLATADALLLAEAARKEWQND